MRFTDNAELTASNMENADILAGTDVSTSTDKKFTLSGLADWLLNRFTGLSLAGSNQSVKAALDGLNSTTNTWKSYPITRIENDYANATSVNRIKLHRYGHLGTMVINFAPTSSIPKTADFVPIGKFDCKFVTAYAVTAPSQNDNEAASLAYNIQADGTVRVYNGHTASATGFFRAVIPVIFDDTSN